MENSKKNSAGGGSGPPDLEEVWREFNRRIRRFLGRGSGQKKHKGSPNPFGHFPQSPDHHPCPKSGLGRRIAMGIFSILVLWIASGLYVVRSGESRAIFRLGRYYDMATSGVHWGWPYPFQYGETIPLSAVRKVEVVRHAAWFSQQMALLNVRCLVQYGVSDARAYILNASNPDVQVAQAAKMAMQEAFRGRKLDEMMLTDTRSQIEIAAVMTKSIQAALDKAKIGICIQSVNIQSVQLPDAISTLFDEIPKIETDNVKQLKAALEDSKQALPKARESATQMVHDAQMYAKRVVTQALGEVAHFEALLPAYLKAPAVTRAYLHALALRGASASSDSSAPLASDSITPHLPHPSNPSDQAASSEVESSLRSRDSLRSRQHPGE